MKILREIEMGDMLLVFKIGGWDGLTVSLTILPLDMKDEVAESKEYQLNPLIEVKSIHDPHGAHYLQGRSLRNSYTAMKMLYQSMEVEDLQDRKQVIIHFANERNLKAISQIVYYKGYDVLEFTSTLINDGVEDEKIETLSSFCLDGITPFAEDESPENLYVHRMRSRWSCEGRHIVESVEDLQLEPSWNNFGPNSVRFGHAGSMPLSGYVPFLGIEDRAKGVMWGAQVAIPGSWQMEVFRRDAGLSISGGLADRELGHWTKTLKPSEKFTSPRAFVTVCRGDIDDLTHRLTAIHNRTYVDVNGAETDMPVLFNEYCLTWGNPTAEAIKATAESLKGKGMKYYIIDAGWYGSRDISWASAQGDWIPNEDMYPNGLKESVDIIKSCGMIPGIWFEFEVCADQSKAYQLDTHKLMRDGKILQVAGRHYWDFRDPWVEEYLTERVINFLRDNGFGYMKVDYNDDIGFGVDGNESPGENLRQHMESVQAFFRKIHQELPELVIENCSSGGHRLEPSMMELVSMASFSDAHEIDAIPIVAANCQRMILPRKSQIWAVVKACDSIKRLVYTMSAAFLGRMCISGEVMSLNSEQWEIVDRGIAFYNKVSHIIRDGRSHRYGPAVVSYLHPKGWQAISRTSGDEMLIVCHGFAGANAQKASIPTENFKISEIYSDNNISAQITDGNLEIEFHDDFQGVVLWLKR